MTHTKQEVGGTWGGGAEARNEGQMIRGRDDGRQRANREREREGGSDTGDRELVFGVCRRCGFRKGPGHQGASRRFLSDQEHAGTSLLPEQEESHLLQSHLPFDLPTLPLKGQEKRGGGGGGGGGGGDIGAKGRPPRGGGSPHTRPTGGGGGGGLSGGW